MFFVFRVLAFGLENSRMGTGPFLEENVMLKNPPSLVSYKLMEFVLKVWYVLFLVEIYAAWALRKCSWLIPRTAGDVAIFTVFWFEVYIVYVFVTQ